MKRESYLPDCFGTFWCPDDCIVSCPYWEDCMEQHDEMEDKEESED